MRPHAHGSIKDGTQIASGLTEDDAGVADFNGCHVHAMTQPVVTQQQSLSLVIFELQSIADHPRVQLSNAGDNTLAAWPLPEREESK